MNIWRYIYNRLHKRPVPGWFVLCDFNITKYVYCNIYIGMGWRFGVELYKEVWPYSARLTVFFYKIHGYVGFGKDKSKKFS